MTQRPLAVLIFLLCLSSAAHSAGYTVLEGRVVDENGRPVSNQPVYIELPRGRTAVFTDNRGVFQFLNLPQGQYTVFVKGGPKVTVEVKNPTKFPFQTLEDALVMRGQ
jgi:uncharacterized GH25 family protein